jgi:membrane fusion protein (multidrug efflux system)
MNTVERSQRGLPVELGAALRNAVAATAACAMMMAPLGCGGDGVSAESTTRNGGRGRPEGPQNLPAMAVAVQPAAVGSIATYYSATASLDPDKQADILARTSGVVERLLAEEGDRVSAGQVLLHLEDDEYRHRVTLAQVDLEQQRLRYERAEKMLAQGLTSTEAYETARRDLRSAEAALELAELELSYTHVRAPFAGRVVRRMVDPGQNVSNGTPLFTLVDMSRLLARVFVPAKEFRSIRPDQPVQLVVTSTGDRLTGRIDLVNPMVDPESGTIKVTVAVRDYPPSTRPGDFVEVSIVTDRHEGALLVPRNAVVSERGQRTVFVAEDGSARQQAVEIGFEDDQHTEIVAGVEEGEMVVVQGQRALRDGQPITILDRMDLDADSEASATSTAAAAQPAG